MSEKEKESARAELRQAAVDYAGLIGTDYDEDAFVNALASLEVSAKAFADSELVKDKARLDWLENQQGLTTCGFSFSWFDEHGQTLRDAIDAAMKNPAG